RSTVTVYGPSAALLGSATAPAAGAEAVLQPVTASVAGTYTVTIGGAGGTQGLYTARIILNAAVEAESHGGTANDTRATAQDISSSSVPLPGGADRLAVQGTFNGNDDLYSFHLNAGQSATL